ncbi:MAG: saccharopine dehydrogenase NADP-binding domain-containing protein [Hormoscilla sp. SP12CHS1]|nr:saccharopine dehydrogenase NADP-binding domain-containing protein [Hormoscilla sp. SP12CHS1]
MTKNILLLGSGTSVPPLCADFSKRDYRLTIASRNLDTASALAAKWGHEALHLNLDGSEASERQLNELVEANDIVVSYTRGGCLPQIADACIKHGKHLVTSSHRVYFDRTSEKDWARRARDRGIMILTEVGSDPGFGRIIGKRLIDKVRADGGEIIDLWYHVAAIPYWPNINPFGYRFSWAPKKAIFTAINMHDDAGNWYKNYQEVRVPSSRVYLDTQLVEVPGVGVFETHPNADSGAHLYREVYGLESARTFYHGTMRYLGWGSALQGLLELGAHDATSRPELKNQTWKQMILSLLGVTDGDPQLLVAKHLGLHPSNETILRYQWLGLFDDRPIDTKGPSTYCDIISELVVDRLGVFDPEDPEEDQMIFYYDVLARFGDKYQHIKSVTNPRRQPGQFSVCSTLTSLTSAMCVRYLLEGSVEGVGIKQPMTADIYEKILQEYEAMGIAEKQTWEEVASDSLQSL